MTIPHETNDKEALAKHACLSSGLEKVILVIDDDEELLNLNQSLLEMEGYTVFTAKSGEKALQLLEHIPQPDLILLDFQMAKMSGPEFLLALGEKHPKLLDTVPVVFLTAMDRIPASRAAGFIRKPFDLEAFLSEVHNFIEKRAPHEPHQH